MALHRELLSYFNTKFMKNLFYVIAFITVATLFTSCTCDEVETPKKEISTIAKDGEEIDPPKQTIPSV
jgi:hypothetical protein